MDSKCTITINAATSRDEVVDVKAEGVAYMVMVEPEGINPYACFSMAKDSDQNARLLSGCVFQTVDQLIKDEMSMEDIYQIIEWAVNKGIENALKRWSVEDEQYYPK